MDSTKQIEKENETLIEQMLRNAEVTPETGDIIDHPVVHKGDDEIPSPMVARVSSAGYIFIYDTRTGDRSKANRNMLSHLFRVKRPDGSPVFTTIKPSFEPKIGNYKCMLHKNAPNRDLYDQMGFAVCPAGHLSSPYQVKRHMQKRHPTEWAAIEHDREEKERVEDRELRRKILENIATPEQYVATQTVPFYEPTKTRGRPKKK